MVSVCSHAGIRQEHAWQESCLLLALGPGASSLHAQWSALWDMLSGQRHAVGIQLPAGATAAGAAAAAAAASGSGGAAGGGGGGGAVSLLLVPNIVDPGSKTLFGLIAEPARRIGYKRSLEGRPAHGILRRAGQVAPDAQAAAAAAAGRHTIGWPDLEAADAQTIDSGNAALELGGGRHYASPRRRAVQVSRPTPLPSSRSLPAAGQQGPAFAGPLDGLRVAMVGFAKTHQVSKANWQWEEG